MIDVRNRLYHAVKSRMLQEASLCGTLRSALSGQQDAAEEKINKARLACEGYHVLPGTMNQPFFVGKPPRWHDNPVGDDEYVVCLNRMAHWNDCIAAYALTGETVFAELIMTELEDWIENCPPLSLEGTPQELCHRYSQPVPWRQLENGIRLLDYWPNALLFLMQEGFMGEALFEKFAECVTEHTKRLILVSPMLWPKADHNHYLMEMLGLFYAGWMLQELPQARSWMEMAERELERCVRFQLTEDGGQIEGCPHYHNVCMYLFCRWAIIARKCGVEIAADCLERIRNGFDYAVNSLRPTGKGVPWGDSDADDQAVRTAVMGYQLYGSRRWLDAIRAFYSEEELRRLCASFCFALSGLDVEDLLLAEAGPEEQGQEPLPLVSWQRSLQQVMIRSSWSKEALSLFFACKIPVCNGHAHIDPAGFDFTALGKALLVDPGRYTYREDEMRRSFKSVQMHNTLTIGNRTPFVYRNTFSFDGEKDGCILNCVEAERFTAAHAIQSSYFPAIHERLAALIDDSFLLIWDRVTHLTTKEPVHIWYHLNSQTATVEADGTVHTADSVNLCMRASEALIPRLHEGMISEVLDVARPSSRVCFSDSGEEGSSRNYLTVICPYRVTAPVISRISQSGDGMEAGFSIDQKAYRCNWKGETFTLT